jgi:HAE1 family hydrophobic/amphiphilic exporter-1
MLIPMMIRQFATGELNFRKENSSGKVLGHLRGFYMARLAWALKHRGMILSIALSLCLFSIFMLTRTPIDFPSTFEENEFAVVTFPLAGARLESNDEAMAKIEEILSKIPDITLFSTTVSKDDLRLFVRLKPARKRQYSKEEIMKIIDEQGNAAVKEIHSDYSLIVDEGAGSSESKKLVVNIYGQDGDELEKLAKEFANKMSKVEGLSNLVMTDLRKRPEYSLVVDKGKAAMYGLSVKSVADTMHAQVRGMRPTKFHELTKGEEIETITRLQAIYRQKLEDLGQVHVETRENVQVPISEIANFYPSTGPQTIDRKDKHRYVFVKGDVKRPIEEIAEDVKKAIREVKLPDDYYWRFGGGFEELMKSKSELGVAVILTVFLVYMVMACLYQSYLYPLLIMATVPMASIGVWLALGWPILFLKPLKFLGLPEAWLTWIPSPKPLSTQVFIGIILLAGYVVNAAIILVDHFTHLDPEKPPTSA